MEEVGWVGSGGGDSETEEPGFWTADSDPFYDQELTQGGRAVPDISMDADPNATAAEVYVNGSTLGVGGTSLSSPLALEIGTTGTGLAAMPNLTRVHIYNATYNGANPQFQTIDELQLDNNNMIEATPSAPSPKKNSFNDCTWATSCPAP